MIKIFLRRSFFFTLDLSDTETQDDYLFLLLQSIHATTQQVPIPPRYDGFAVGTNTNAPIQFEIFYDLMCPDSRHSFYITTIRITPTGWQVSCITLVLLLLLT